MKALKYFFYLLMISIIVTSCDERDFDTPPLTGPSYTGDSTNITIAELKALYKDYSLKYINEGHIIQGYVTANDESGNLYKQMVIQDETGGITLSVDKSGLNSGYKVGQLVFIQLKGLYFGKYNGTEQIGLDNEGSIGRMSIDVFNEHVFRDALPKLENVSSKLITLSAAGGLVDENISKLVRIENVTFINGGKAIYAPSTYSANSEGVIGTSVNEFVVRTSSYANFAADTLPVGPVNLVGILTKYSTSSRTIWQLAIRSREDVTEYNPEKGATASNPFNVDEALAKGEDTAKKWWVKGFIVGSLNGGVNPGEPADGPDDFILDKDFLPGSIVIATNADETDWTKFMLVQLTTGTDAKKVLDLLDHPSNKGKEVTLNGSLVKSLGILNVQLETGKSSEFIFEGGDDPDPEPGTGDGSKENPYNVTQAKANQGATGNTDYKWIEGYIVGVYNDPDKSYVGKFEAPFTINTNILIANSSTENNVANCIVVQLPTGVRPALNLVNNANSLGAKVKLEGTLETYFQSEGIKNTREYVLDGSVDPEPEPGEGTGTQSDPYSVAKAATIQGQGTIGWTQGYIVGAVKNGVTSVSGAADVLFAGPFDSSTNVLIADSKTETDYTKCLIVNLPAGTELRSQVSLQNNAVNLGAKLNVKGTLRVYFGLPGLRDSGGTSADFVLTGSSTPEPGDNILNAPFSSDMGGFTTVSVAGDQVWAINTQYKNVNMSGFVDGTNHANEDWLVSPKMNLTGKTSATLAYAYTISKGAGNTVTQDYMKANQTVWVTDNYTGTPSTTTWTQLNYTTFPTGTNWVYVNASIALPSSVMGKNNVVIAFKYTCDNTDSATWQINNLTVK